MKAMKLRTIICLVIAVILAVSLAACDGSGKDAKDNGKNGTELSGSFQIRGSDTEVNMVQRLTEVYRDKQPKVEFSVTGGGSGTGIAALINKQIDVANSSRAMKDDEIQQAKANGVNPVAFVFAQDGLAVIVHKDNQIESLTIEQVGKIFSGEIKNWKEVGGADKAISTYGRQSNSGTFSYFRDAVVKTDYSADKKMMNGNAQIVEGVIADAAGIGYVGVGYAGKDGKPAEGLKVLKLAKDDSSTAVSPLEMENVLNGTYPIVRPLYHYTNGTPVGALKDYLEFVFSAEGQDIVKEMGFFPINSQYAAENSNNLK